MHIRKGFVLAAGLLIAAGLGGCGTIGGLASDAYPSKVYVGIQVHVQTCGEKEHGIPAWLLFFWDPPLCLVADTLLLPGTLTYELFRPRKPSANRNVER